MKHNWTYKKLGEVATIIGGSTPLTSIPANWKGSNRWVTPAELDGSKYIGDTQRTISDEAASKLSLLPVGTVLFSSRAPIGKVAITTKPMYCNQGFKNVVCGDELLNEYVYLYLTHNIPTLQALGVGATFKEISKSKMEQFAIPVPPIHEQKELVQELNSIKHLIELQGQQLREYDRLAQSLFYTTFGDPATNPKGWEVKKLGDIATVKIGPFGSLLHTSDYIKGGVPLVNPIHMKNGYIIADDNFTVSGQKSEELSSYRMSSGDFIFARRGDIGRCAIVTNKEDGFLCGTGSLFVRFDKSIVPIYALFWTKCESFVKELTSKAKGATMLNINCGIVENLLLPLPPLALQQTFAAQIEAIEQQKALIRRSLNQTRTLLASRMQYYFE